MCIKVVGESEFNDVVFLSVDTISGRQSVDISKSDIVKNAKQLIDTAYGLLEIGHSDSSGDDYEHAMNLLIDVNESLSDA